MKRRILILCALACVCVFAAILYAQQQKSVQQLSPDRVDLETQTLVGKRLERTETGPNGENVYHMLYRVEARQTIKNLRYMTDYRYGISYTTEGFKPNDSITLLSLNEETETDSPIWVYSVVYYGGGSRKINFDTSGSVHVPTFSTVSGETPDCDCASGNCNGNHSTECGCGCKNSNCTCTCHDPDCPCEGEESHDECSCCSPPDCNCSCHPLCYFNTCYKNTCLEEDEEGDYVCTHSCDCHCDCVMSLCGENECTYKLCARPDCSCHKCPLNKCPRDCNGIICTDENCSHEECSCKCKCKCHGVCCKNICPVNCEGNDDPSKCPYQCKCHCSCSAD